MFGVSAFFLLLFLRLDITTVTFRLVIRCPRAHVLLLLARTGAVTTAPTFGLLMGSCLSIQLFSRVILWGVFLTDFVRGSPNFSTQLVWVFHCVICRKVFLFSDLGSWPFRREGSQRPRVSDEDDFLASQPPIHIVCYRLRFDVFL